MSKRTIALDFDGVLHSYTSGWSGPDVISDPPVTRMAQACHHLIQAGFHLVVMSSRARYPQGLDSMRTWLDAHGFPAMEITAEKVPALLYVDDRGYRFDGDVRAMVEFITGTDMEPWNRGEQIQEDQP